MSQPQLARMALAKCDPWRWSLCRSSYERVHYFENMSQHKKTWILVKGSEFNPGRSISLGQILIKPFEPSLPLLPDGPLRIPETSLERSHQTGVKTGSRTALGISFALWAEADLLPVSGNVGGKRETSQEEEWEFDRLDSEIMVPRLSDVQAALRRDEVVAQIRRSKFDYRKRLYMITGVRIARGARLSRKDSKARGGNTKIMVDLATVSAVPLKVGPDVDITRENEESYSFKEASDFVYAYRVCEVHYGKDVHTTAYNRGDTFADGKEAGEEGGGDESGEDSENDNEEKTVHILVEKIADSDFAGSGEASQAKLLGAADEEQFIISAAS